MSGSHKHGGPFVCVIAMCKIILTSVKRIMSLKTVRINPSANRINSHMPRV